MTAIANPREQVSERVAESMKAGTVVWCDFVELRSDGVPCGVGATLYLAPYPNGEEPVPRQFRGNDWGDLYAQLSEHLDKLDNGPFGRYQPVTYLPSDDLPTDTFDRDANKFLVGLFAIPLIATFVAWLLFGR